VLDVEANRGFSLVLLRALATPVGSFLTTAPPRHPGPPPPSYEALKAVAAKRELWRVFPYALGWRRMSGENINVAGGGTVFSSLTPRAESQVQISNNKMAVRRGCRSALDSVMGDVFDRYFIAPALLKTPPHKVRPLGHGMSERHLARILALQRKCMSIQLYHGMHNFAESIRKFRPQSFEVIDCATV